MKIFPIGNQTFAALAALLAAAGLLQAEDAAVNKERIIETVRFLSEENFPRTATHKNKENTIDYIINSIAAAGFEPVRSDFALKRVLDDDDGITIELQRITLTNIHALKKGKTGRRIIIGAHYDAMPESPGADDNASGVAVLVELAHLLKETAELNCDVELVSYDVEEWGLWGSRYHAKKLKSQKVDVACMLCMDMVGYYSDADNSQRYPVSGMSLLYGTKGNFLAMLGRPQDTKLITGAHKAFQEATTLRLVPFSTPKPLELLTSRSDHAPFLWEGYPALFFTDMADFRNNNYHRETDTWDTLDYDRLAQVAVGLYHVMLMIDVAAPAEVQPLKPGIPAATAPLLPAGQLP